MNLVAVGRRYARGGAVGAVAILAAVSAAVAFVVNILMARVLGPGARGEVALVLQMAYFATPWILLGRERALLRAHSGVFLPLRLVIYGLPLLLLGWLHPRGHFAAVFFVAISGAYIAIARSNAIREGRVAKYARLMLAYQGSILGGAVLLAVLGTSESIIWVVPYAVFAVPVIFHELRTKNLRLSREVLSQDMRWVRLLPATVASQAITRMDRLILPLVSSVASLGIYVAVATATEPLNWMAQSLADHRVSRRPQLASPSVFIKRIAWDLIYLIPLAAVIAGSLKVLLMPALGSQFSGGASLIMPLSLAGVALALYRQSVTALLGGDSPQRSSTCEVVTAIVALPLYVGAIREWGALGAAWASLVVYGIGFTIAVSFMGKGGQESRVGQEVGER